MEWRGEAIILEAARYGENDAILTVLARDQGKTRGFVKGGSGKRQRGALQPGNKLDVTWYSRLEDGLGRFTCDLAHASVGAMMGDGARLSALQAALTSVQVALPEREGQQEVYRALDAYISLLETPASGMLDWGQALVRLELGLLAHLGYGLDLGTCADTGQAHDLAYVSPKSARAVCQSSGQPYHDKLLPLPSFLTAGDDTVRRAHIADGLRLTSYFLERHIWQVRKSGPPDARLRFAFLYEE